jgi:hypothetical protein
LELLWKQLAKKRTLDLLVNFHGFLWEEPGEADAHVTAVQVNQTLLERGPVFIPKFTYSGPLYMR